MFKLYLNHIQIIFKSYNIEKKFQELNASTAELLLPKVWTDFLTRIESPGNRIDQKRTLGSLKEKTLSIFGLCFWFRDVGQRQQHNLHRVVSFCWQSLEIFVNQLQILES